MNLNSREGDVHNAYPPFFFPIPRRWGLCALGVLGGARGKRKKKELRARVLVT